MKKIKFRPMSEDTAKLDPPTPARSSVPEWYKKAKRFRSGQMEILNDNGGLNKDIKLCIPFLDALTSGYMLTMPTDLLVKRDEKGVERGPVYY